jgi:hypothetical protein
MGAVKEYLKEQLKDDLKAKGLCVWLDSKSEYTNFVNEELENKDFPYPLLTFKGSFLELMMELAPYFKEKDPKPCLIHMPSFNNSSIKETPLLEAYKAGKELQYNLKTLVRNASAGKLANEQLNFLLEDENFSLELADNRLTEEDQTPEGLKRLITRYSSLEIAIQLLDEKRNFDDLIEMPKEQWFDAFFQYLELHFGISKEWFDYWKEESNTEDPLNILRIPLASHLLCTEYTWDLKSEPIHSELKKLKDISEIQHKNCIRITKELRERFPELYKKLSKEIEPHIEDEKNQDSNNLGDIDTFSFEEEKILSLAFSFIENKEWNKVLEIYKKRLGTKKDKEWDSFWVQQDNSKRWVWKLIELSTRLAQLIAKGISTISDWNRISPVQITNTYTNQLFKIDQTHRDFEQWTSHLKTLTSLPNFAQITKLIKDRRVEYRDFINNLTNIFNESCKQFGFLPPEEYRQRTFHKQVVEPALSEAPTVVFYIDAFRYELGEELAKLLREDKGEVKISSRLAELPTVTSVGMNALLPLDKSGYLTPAFDKQKGKFIGFKTSEKTIDGPSSREKLLREHSGVTMSWISLKEMSDKSHEEMKKTLNGKKLIIVHSLEIDELGETGLLSLIPDYFEQTLTRILTVVKRLEIIGFQQFIFTSDHGFIQADETLKGEKIPHVDVETRRYILHSTSLESSLVKSVSMAELNYNVDDSSWLLFSPTADLFQKPGNKDRFYHGGNSLQERVIPVISYKKKKSSLLADDEDFEINVKSKPPVLGSNRITLKAERTGSFNMLAPQNLLLQLDIPSEYNANLQIAEIVNGEKIGNQINIPIEQEVEIFFRIQGVNVSKAPLRITRPQRFDSSKELITDEFFDVISESIISSTRENTNNLSDNVNESSITSSLDISSSDSNIEIESTSISGVGLLSRVEVNYTSSIPEEFHHILNHIKNHGIITENSLVNMLGGGSQGARKSRRFASNIQDWLIHLPFNIEITTTNEGKTYRKAN